MHLPHRRRRPRSLTELLAANIARAGQLAAPVAVLLPLRQPEGRFIPGNSAWFVELEFAPVYLN
jgi:hypothetical protein